MLRADFKVFLDACVLVNFPVCDLLLRLAEPPRLYIPKWSSTVLDETHRAHVGKLEWETKLADTFRASLTKAFPDAETNDYEHIIPALTNHEKDRHVLAAAIRSGSSLLLTFNLRDFPAEALAPWQVCAKHPQDYLLDLYSMEPQIVVQKIAEIAAEKQRDFSDQVLRFGKHLPAFCAHLIDDLNLEI